MKIKKHTYNFYLCNFRANSYLWKLGKGLLGTKVLTALCFFFLLSSSVNAEIKTIPNQDTSTIKEVNRDFQCECYEVFFSLFKKIYSVSHVGNVYTYVLLDEIPFTGQTVTINLDTYELTLKRDLMNTTPEGYKQNYHFTYHCKAMNSPALVKFNTTLSNLLNADNSIKRAYHWPREVNFTMDSGWTYYEKTPLERYLFKGSDTISMDANTVTPSIGLQPNPAVNVLKMKWYDMKLFGPYKLIITDMQGKAVYQKEIIIANKEGVFEVPVANLKPGNFIFHLGNDKMDIDQPFIIAR